MIDILASWLTAWEWLAALTVWAFIASALALLGFCAAGIFLLGRHVGDKFADAWHLCEAVARLDDPATWDLLNDTRKEASNETTR
ncbi:hypothetical protein ACWERY_02365 [Streptomyces sp. NPDC004082]